MIRFIREVFKRIKWSYRTNRPGPDILSTYFLMYSPSLAKNCEKKFKAFRKGSEVRYSAVVIGCSNIELGESVILRSYTYLVCYCSRKYCE